MTQDRTTVLPVRAAVIPTVLPALTTLQKRTVFAIALAGCMLRLFFWAYTDRTWEDALISVLHSENLASGLGLTHYHPGHPPVHGFTSPLSVLIPLAADIIHVGWGLIFLKLVSAVIVIPTIVLAAAVASHRAFHINIWLVYLLCGYLALEHHQILWGMAGMETQVAVFVLFLTLYSALIEAPTGLGIAMALCLYTRPDFAIFLVPVVAYRFLINRSALLRTLVIAGSLYAPWLIFTTLYYGSPVPHTVVAKSLGYDLWTSHVALFSQSFWLNTRARFADWIFVPLGPSFSGHGTGFLKFMDEGLISRICMVLILLGSIAMIFRWHKFYIIPLGSLMAYSIYYVYFVAAIFGWYLVPFNAINCLVLVLALGALCNTLLLPAWIAPLSLAACIAYLLPFIAIVPVTFRTEKDIQQYVENPVRKAIGQYLFAHKKPGETVGSESLGYLAYYSRMPEYDYPGLASTEVTDFLKQYPDRRSIGGVQEHFRPDWIVLRRDEFIEYSRHPDMQFLQADYHLEKSFRADPQRVAGIFGIEHNIDTAFYLLKKGAYSNQVSLSIVNPALIDSPVAIQGSWKVNGQEPSVGRPSVDGPVYGSWNGSDANVGTIRLGPFQTGLHSSIAIPVVAGPDVEGLSLKVLNAATGATLAMTNPVQPRMGWWAWNVDLPPGPDTAVEIVAEDSGTKWGEWMAIGLPHFAPRIRAALTGNSVTIQGSWAKNGYHSDAGHPPVEGEFYGSYNGADANVGTLRLGPFPINRQSVIAIPVVTGPGNGGLSLKVLHTRTGKVIDSLNPVPIRTKWWIWEASLPPDPGGSFEIVAEDSGTAYGQWLAIGQPHAVK